MEKKKDSPDYRDLLESIQNIATLIQNAQRSTLRKKWFNGNSGEDIALPQIEPKTLYVDNTANANALTLKMNGDLGVWTIPANGSRYIPCEGNTSLSISGVGTCFILAINRELFLGN